MPNATAEQLRRFGIGCLYYMFPIENLPSILTLGILSHNHVSALSHQSFSDWAVQRRRSSLIPFRGKSLHDYVPLYFGSHTPMQYHFTQSTRRVIEQDDLIFIELDALKVFELPDVIYTDGNAASSGTVAYLMPAYLRKLDWHLIYHVRRCYSKEYKRRKSAEVLVPNSVPTECFLRMVVFNESSRRRVMKLLDRIVNRDVIRIRCELDLSLYY